jgi:hypothetical protein
MLQEETIDFWNNQNLQLDNIQGEDLNAVYARFDESFILYGRLTKEVPSILRAKGIVINDGDFKNDNLRATDFPIRFLGADAIINALNDKALLGNFNGFAKLIDQEVFHMRFNRDEVHDRNADLALSKDLTSANNHTKVSALLHLIYQARNNRQHSRKHVEEHQRLLLEPMYAILMAINTLLFKEMNR